MVTYKNLNVAPGGRRHHLDRRAAELAAQGAGDPDDLLSTTELSEWLGLSTQWLEIGRCKKYGPPFILIAPRRIRYRRSDVLRWLEERTYRCTAEYAGGAAAVE